MLLKPLILVVVSNFHFDNVDFVLDSKQVMDSFHTWVDDDSELGCIITASIEYFRIVFKTRMSSLI